MKKIIALSIVTFLISLTFAGCQGTSPTAHVSKQHYTQEKIHSIIKKAGVENGWIMTEFKKNTLIAEKVNGNNATSVTITFDNSSFNISPANSDLENAINNAL